jgi:tryptophanyl-tRNA synthetase
LCGLRPTGRLHLGHYFSVIKPALAGAEVLIANYHAPEETNVEGVVATLKKFGVSKIRHQRDVFDPELFFRMLNIANFGELSRMTQFKSSENPTAQLLTYPVLMAHDVAGYEEVFVGDDQAQHLQFARHLIARYNKAFGGNFPPPRARIVGGRIRDLRESAKKMSKSSPKGCLFLDDEPEVVRAKLRAAVMDEAGRENMVTLYNEFVRGEAPEKNVDLKEAVAASFIQKLV